ncbi:MAG TPA: hypothetical protein VLA34_01100 [Candidatus Krumholzibacterium sp.]|nr:hypothetical protein [Candidatus Krumholzibacterium sp.]
MKKALTTSMLFVFAAVLLFSPGAARSEGTKIGIGAMISNDVLREGGEMMYSLGSTMFTVPIVFGTFKVEPELGFYRLSLEDDYSYSRMVLGAGFGYILARDDISICLGAHFGMDRLSFSGGDDDESFTNMYFGPLVEGEYYLAESFSLGARVSLDFQTFDDAFEPEMIITHKTFGFIRFYF